MTIAQQLEQKGFEIGERVATLKIARTMLQKGFHRNTVMKITGLGGDSLALIHHK